MLFITLTYHINVLNKINSDAYNDSDEDPDFETDSDSSEDSWHPGPEIDAELEILKAMMIDGQEIEATPQANLQIPSVRAFVEAHNNEDSSNSTQPQPSAT